MLLLRGMGQEWGRGFFSKPKHMTSCWGRRNPENLFFFSEKWVPGLELHVVGGFVACLSQAPSWASCWAPWEPARVAVCIFGPLCCVTSSAIKGLVKESRSKMIFPRQIPISGKITACFKGWHRLMFYCGSSLAFCKPARVALPPGDALGYRCWDGVGMGTFFTRGPIMLTMR